MEPSYLDVWVDSPITLKHKLRATTKLTEPIKRITILEAAHNPPFTITNEAKISEATTSMMLYGYSQLPVTSGSRTIIGFVSWETIGKAKARGVNRSGFGKLDRELRWT